MRTRALGCILTLVGILACADSLTAPDPATGPGPAPTRITELPRPLTAQEVVLSGASNSFGLNLLAELSAAAPDDNLFFSPLSASMALGMTLNGADGNTYAEMRDVLGFATMSQEQINESYASLLELLAGLDPAVTVEIANSLWLARGKPIASEFVDRVRTYFDAEVDEVLFTDPATVDRINAWVAEKTHGKIEDIVQPGDFDAGTVAALLNAIYFLGDWTGRFDPALTAPGPFRRPDDSEVEADFMFRYGTFAYRNGDRHRLIELPYGGQAFAMTLILPDEGTTTAELLDDLDAAMWEDWVTDLDSISIQLRLPKFELEWESGLIPALKAMGMVDAFSALADFSRLTPAGVSITEVRQKAYVKVDEEGTEAAAVTLVVLGRTSAVPARLNFDRPFIFAIRERLSGTLLFMGIMNDPAAA